MQMISSNALKEFGPLKWLSPLTLMVKVVQDELPLERVQADFQVAKLTLCLYNTQLTPVTSVQQERKG